MPLGIISSTQKSLHLMSTLNNLAIFGCSITFPTYLVLPLSINVTTLDYLVNYVPFAKLRFARLRFILETYTFFLQFWIFVFLFHSRCCVILFCC